MKSHELQNPRYPWCSKPDKIPTRAKFQACFGGFIQKSLVAGGTQIVSMNSGEVGIPPWAALGTGDGAENRPGPTVWELADWGDRHQADTYIKQSQGRPSALKKDTRTHTCPRRVRESAVRGAPSRQSCWRDLSAEVTCEHKPE